MCNALPDKRRRRTRHWSCGYSAFRRWPWPPDARRTFDLWPDSSAHIPWRLQTGHTQWHVWRTWQLLHTIYSNSKKTTRSRYMSAVQIVYLFTYCVWQMCHGLMQICVTHQGCFMQCTYSNCGDDGRWNFWINKNKLVWLSPVIICKSNVYNSVHIRRCNDWWFCSALLHLHVHVHLCVDVHTEMYQPTWPQKFLIRKILQEGIEGRMGNCIKLCVLNDVTMSIAHRHVYM